MSDPFVSVIIPVHNHAQWVNDAVNSVLMQDYPNKRIVLVDDGSTDGSAEVVAERLCMNRYPETQGEPWVCLGKTMDYMNIKDSPSWAGIDVLIYKFKEARGPSFARNWGIRSVWENTDIYALLDSDDMYSQGTISKSVKRIVESNGAIGAVYSDYDTLRPDSLRLRQYKEPFSRERLVSECIVNCDSLITKAALELAGLFDETLRVTEDWDEWLRVSEGHVISHIPESLVTIRVGTHSSTSQVQQATWNTCHARTVEKLHERHK